MAAWTAATRQATNLARISSPRTYPTLQTASSLIHRRGMAGGGDHHGPPKVNFWQKPMDPARWKEEHFVLISLAGWGLLGFGAYKFFTRGKKDKNGEKVGEAQQ